MLLNTLLAAASRPSPRALFMTSDRLLHRTVRPYGVYALHGLAYDATRNAILAIDSARGYLVEIDPATDDTRTLNPYHAEEFIGVTGIALAGDRLWFTRSDSIYSCAIGDFAQPGRLEPKLLASLPYGASGIALWQSVVYVCSQKSGYIYALHNETGAELARYNAPGVGLENLFVRDGQLWVSDTIEQTVYCLDRETGEVEFQLLTPFPTPTGLCFFPQDGDDDILYIAYAREEPYIRDDPNAANPYQLTFRDTTFLHPLHVYHNPESRYTLSNGYLVEMSYVEELAALDPVVLEGIEWQIAVPMDSPRQKVRSIEPVGLPFELREIDGQMMAVFPFDRLDEYETHLFGWKATLELRGIKYHFRPSDAETDAEIPEGYTDLYLVDNDNLTMDADIVQRAAHAAIGSETNLLRKVLNIRDYTYDRLEYGIKPQIDTPDVVLRRGMGSCGEYVGVFLALLRLNGIPCRTVGRYKCPDRAEQQRMPLQPDFNHVWIEFYVPGYGWIPMESNPDDIDDRGPYPMRFFMGLAWYHVEIVKGVKFERIMKDGKRIDKEVASLGDLSINHVRFQILEELPPATA